MKFRLVYTVDQTQVGNVLAAMQQSDADFEGPEIVPIVEQRALPPPSPTLPPRGQAPAPSQRATSVAVVRDWLRQNHPTTFQTSDVHALLGEHGFGHSRAGFVLNKMIGDGLIKNARRGWYESTILSQQLAQTLPAMTLDLLARCGVATNADVKKLAKTYGYAPSGVGAMLSKMQARGHIHQPLPQIWAAGPEPETKGDMSGTRTSTDPDEAPS